MKKLKLDLEALTVDTFSTGADVAGRGTVEGLYAEEPTTSMNNQVTCGGVNTCNGAASCVSCSFCITEPADEVEGWA